MSALTNPNKASTTASTLNDASVNVSSDHIYSSPTPQPIQVSSLQAKPTSDHTYAEHSDTPTEPYGSDTEHTLDSVSTGVTKEGQFIVASTDKLEISVEYLSSTTLLEATGMSKNASEMLLDASNAGIVRASPDKSVHSLLPDETTDHEALLEATTATEPQNGSLTDETHQLLPDEPNQAVSLYAVANKTLQEATDATKHSTVQLSDETSDVLSDKTRTKNIGLSDEMAATTNRTNSSSELPETTEDLPLKETEPDHNGGMTVQNEPVTDVTNQEGQGSVSPEKSDNTNIEEAESTAEHDETNSAIVPPVPNTNLSAQPCQNDETGSVGTTPLHLSEVKPSKEQTDIMETTTKQVIGEISYTECSDELHSAKSTSEIPINFKPVETSSVVSELPEFSHTPDTTLTNMSNSSSGLSLLQGTSASDKNNNDVSNFNSTVSSGSSRTKRKHLKTCIIRLTELSNQEWEQWMTGSSHTTSTPSSTSSANEESSTGTNDSRYNMHARYRTSVTSNRSTGWKRTVVNYAEQGIQDSGCDSDHEIKLKPPQPLDNKSYPSANRYSACD